MATWEEVTRLKIMAAKRELVEVQERAAFLQSIVDCGEAFLAFGADGALLVDNPEPVAAEAIPPTDYVRRDSSGQFIPTASPVESPDNGKGFFTCANCGQEQTPTRYRRARRYHGEQWGYREPICGPCWMHLRKPRLGISLTELSQQASGTGGIDGAVLVS